MLEAASRPATHLPPKLVMRSCGASPEAACLPCLPSRCTAGAQDEPEFEGGECEVSECIFVHRQIASSLCVAIIPADTQEVEAVRPYGPPAEPIIGIMKETVALEMPVGPTLPSKSPRNRLPSSSELRSSSLGYPEGHGSNESQILDFVSRASLTRSSQPRSRALASYASPTLSMGRIEPQLGIAPQLMRSQSAAPVGSAETFVRASLPESERNDGAKSGPMPPRHLNFSSRVGVHGRRRSYSHSPTPRLRTSTLARKH
jgi:hypothetical protein